MLLWKVITGLNSGSPLLSLIIIIKFVLIVKKKLVQPRVCWQVEIFTLFPKEKISDMHLLRYANSILLATKNA